MALSQTVWSLDEKKPLAPASLIDEKELELLLRDNIEILNKGWLVISNQVRTDAGKFIDILCIDHDGDMVVVELKKDLTQRENMALSRQAVAAGIQKHLPFYLQVIECG